TQESYQLKIAGYEGPFNLLLNLIEKRKLFINDVSLAVVTEDYLNYMNKLGGLNPAEIASFVLVASTLILIKSKSLLPNLNLTGEEEGDIHSLEERLRLFELYTKLGGHIKENFGENIIFAPLERKNELLIFLPDDKITSKNMMEFARGALGSMPKKIFLPEVEVRKVVSIEEMIDNLTERIKSSIKMSFKDFAGKAVTREEKVFVIVGFLAMLELVRNGILHVIQENDFSDIIIEKVEITSEITL
ncbi:MAG: segregation/condensation protein A, partial [Patescibacteria group bacterium]